MHTPGKEARGKGEGEGKGEVLPFAHWLDFAKRDFGTIQCNQHGNFHRSFQKKVSLFNEVMNTGMCAATPCPHLTLTSEHPLTDGFQLCVKFEGLFSVSLGVAPGALCMLATDSATGRTPASLSCMFGVYNTDKAPNPKYNKASSGKSHLSCTVPSQVSTCRPV